MNKVLQKVAFVFLLAAMVHLVLIWQIPSLIMKAVMHRASKSKIHNNHIHAKPISWKSRTVVMPSPDLLYTLCVFDVSKVDLLIRGKVPSSYWSLAFYDSQTNNFFVFNDKTEKAGPKQWRLIGPNSPRPKGYKGKVVRSPTARGVVLFRILIKEKARLSHYQAIQKQTSCQPARHGK